MIPGLGALRVRELTVGAVDRLLTIIAKKHGPAAAKQARAVLSSMCGLAARHDALDRNVVRDAGPIAEAPQKEQPRALTIAQLRQLRIALRKDGSSHAPPQARSSTTGPPARDRTRRVVRTGKPSLLRH